MLTTSIFCFLTVLALAAMVGLVLFPFAVLTGLWANRSAKEDTAKADAIDALLAND